ncbi:YdbH domain-containing protein [Pseudomonadota bacterium]
MTKWRTTVLILSLPVALAIVLWFFAAGIAGALAPSLLNSEAIQITSLDITSIGLDSTRIRRLKGISQTPAGTTAFDIKDAVVYYTLPRLEPERIRIGRAWVDHHIAPVLESAASDTTAFALPSPVTVDQLHLKYADTYEFIGSFAFTGSGQAFTIDAIDERAHLTVQGDASLSSFHISINGPDQKNIGSGRLDLDGSNPTSFAMELHLGPALNWLRGMGLIPVMLTAQTDNIKSVTGDLVLEGRANTTGSWVLDLDLDLHRLATEQFNASGKIAGGLVPGDDGWIFTLSRDGEIRLTTVDELLTDIFSFNAALPPGYSVSYAIAPAGEQTINGTGDAAVAFYRSGDVDLKAQLSQWSLQGWRQAHFRMHDVAFSDPAELTVDSLESSTTLGDSPAGTASLSRVRPDLWPSDIMPADIQVKWEWNEGAIISSGSARLGSPPEIEWNLTSRGDLGRVRIELDTTLSNLMKPFKKYLKNRKYDLELIEGTTRGVINWSWDHDRYDNNLEFTAVDIGGRFMGLDFSNALFELSSSDLVALTMRLSGSFPSVNLANNVDVTDISFAGRWQSGLHLDQASFSVLGGSVKINPVFIDPGSPAVSTELEISDLDLAQVMAMIDLNGLGGSGRLSGVIPLTLKGTAVAIDDGYLKNTTLGELHYAAGDDAAPQLNNIAVQALKDFRYDLLDATLNYQIDGQYSIRARIEGNNPALYNGYPVAFNLNLTGSLPGLLRASLVTGDFHGEIMKQIKHNQ